MLDRPTPNEPDKRGRRWLTVEQVAKRVAAIDKKAVNDDEGAHASQDKLYVAVLKAIARGAPDAADLAKEAVKVEDISFCRWYA
jgi:hypothetical protein